MRTLFLAFMVFTIPAWGQSNLAQLSPAQQIFVGGITGAANATAVCPLILIKNQLQQGKGLKGIVAEINKGHELLLKQAHAFSDRKQLNPVSRKALCLAASAAAPGKVFYRGYPVFASCFTPVIAVQVTVAGQLAKLAGGRELEAKEKLAVNAAAGAASAVISNQSELAMLHQQNNGGSLLRTIRALRSQYGLQVLARGVGATAGRDAGFAAGYGAVYPVLKQKLSQLDDSDDKIVAQVCASIGAGATTTLISHPFDTIKTVLQRDVGRQEYCNMWHAAWKMYQAKGVKAFIPGIVARGTMVTFAVSFMGNFKEQATRMMIDRNSRNNQA